METSGTAPKKIRKVLFVYLMIEEEFGAGKEKFLLKFFRGAPLGFEYMSAVLKQERNIHADILDERITPFTARDLANKIRDENYDLVGFYLCTDPELEKKAVYTLKALKENINVPIVAGGPTFDRMPILEAGCDMICYGEGERTILQIVDVFDGTLDAAEAKGVTYLRDGKEIVNEPQPLIENLDDIPFPIRDHRATTIYDCIGNPNMRMPYISVIASRGCPMRCTFCNTSDIWGKKLRYRSCDNVIAEIEALVAEYGPCYLAFRDDIFGARQGWLVEFCEKVIEKKLPVKWGCNQHPRIPRAGYEKTIPLMAKAGCNTMHFGIQSADEDVLRKIKRNPIELDLMKKKIAVTKKAGIITFVDFIIGLPGETEDSIKKSIKYVFEAKPGFVTFYSLGILHGSQIDEEYVRKGAQITSLTQEEIDRWVRVARRKYMLHPRTVLYLLGYVLRRNPGYLLVLLKVIPQAMSMLGLGKKWKTF